jgi:hypothetical protein
MEVMLHCRSCAGHSMILEHFLTSLSWMSDVTVAMALSMHS